MNYSPILTINTNQTDHIYVVGDLHGCYSLLMQELQKNHFDFQNSLDTSTSFVSRGRVAFSVLSVQLLVAIVVATKSACDAFSGEPRAVAPPAPASAATGDLSALRTAFAASCMAQINDGCASVIAGAGVGAGLSHGGASINSAQNSVAMSAVALA